MVNDPSDKIISSIKMRYLKDDLYEFEENALDDVDIVLYEPRGRGKRESRQPSKYRDDF